jgi:hypothetical protein
VLNLHVADGASSMFSDADAMVLISEIVHRHGDAK